MAPRKTLTLLMMTTLAALGAGTGENRDTLIGWYNLPRHHYRTRKNLPFPGRLIPIFKRGEGYYSVCRGAEVPLKACPEGLEWGIDESSMKGTKIGFDKTRGEPFILIEDRNARYASEGENENGLWVMTRIEKPSGLLDSTIAAPRSNDDFIGCYQFVWGGRPFRIVIAKKDGKYRYEPWAIAKSGWVFAEESAFELSTFRDKLGFHWEHGNIELTYNPALKRFEITGPARVVRSPLARVSLSTPFMGSEAASRLAIGVPSQE